MGVALCPTAQQRRVLTAGSNAKRAHVEPEQPDAEDRSEGVGPATDSPMGRPSVIALVTPSWPQCYTKSGSHHSVAERCTFRPRRAGRIPSRPYSGPPKLARAWLRLQMFQANRACTCNVAPSISIGDAEGRREEGAKKQRIAGRNRQQPKQIVSLEACVRLTTRCTRKITTARAIARCTALASSCDISDDSNFSRPEHHLSVLLASKVARPATTAYCASSDPLCTKTGRGAS